MYQKLFNKDIPHPVAVGLDANLAKFTYEASQGEIALCTDTGRVVIATTSAGASDATLLSLNEAPGAEISADTSKGALDVGLSFPVDTSADRDIYIRSVPAGFKMSLITDSATASITGIYYAGIINNSSAAPASAINDANGIDDSETGDITVDDSSAFPASGYVLIDDEIIQYTSKPTGTTLGGTITRGALGTTAAAHADDAAVTGFQSITPSATTANLKIELFSYATGKINVTEQ